MARYSLKSVAGVSLLAFAAACASAPPALLTKSPEVVSNCEKVGDVSTDSYTPNDQVVHILAKDAAGKGGNYVLVASDEARSGVAYRCSMPSATGGGH